MERKRNMMCDFPKMTNGTARLSSPFFSYLAVVWNNKKNVFFCVWEKQYLSNAKRFGRYRPFLSSLVVTQPSASSLTFSWGGNFLKQKPTFLKLVTNFYLKMALQRVFANTYSNQFLKKENSIVAQKGNYWLWFWFYYRFM